MNHIRLRAIRPDDEQALIDFYARLSTVSRRARFLGTCAGISIECAGRMSNPDGRQEAGFVAEQMKNGLPAVVGHVSLTSAGEDEVEIGIAVADVLQNQGIGSRLFRVATRWAERHGVKRIVATALTDNWRVIHLLGSSSHGALVRNAGAGVSSIAIELRQPSDQMRVPTPWRGSGMQLRKIA